VIQYSNWLHQLNKTLWDQVN